MRPNLGESEAQRPPSRSFYRARSAARADDPNFADDNLDAAGLMNCFAGINLISFFYRCIH